MMDKAYFSFSYKRESGVGSCGISEDKIYLSRLFSAQSFLLLLVITLMGLSSHVTQPSLP